MATSPVFIEGQQQHVIYTDASYNYICEAHASAALTDEVWRVQRITLAGDRGIWASGSPSLTHAATDLATVQALFA